jgi:hypothetical protein
MNVVQRCWSFIKMTFTVLFLKWTAQNSRYWKSWQTKLKQAIMFYTRNSVELSNFKLGSLYQAANVYIIPGDANATYTRKFKYNPIGHHSFVINTWLMVLCKIFVISSVNLSLTSMRRNTFSGNSFWKSKYFPMSERPINWWKTLET